MQTIMSQKSVLCGTSSRVQERSQRSSRASLAVRAENESRRQILTGLFAGVAGLSLAKQANAAIEVFDDRKARERGFDLIYEARDIDLPQNQRDGFTQARGSLEDTKKRIAEAEKRIDTKLPQYINKKYWTNAKEELRLQLGNLRFDLDTLSAQLPKEERKKAKALNKTFFQEADNLDFAIREKNQENAQAALTIVRESLDQVLKGRVDS